MVVVARQQIMSRSDSKSAYDLLVRVFAMGFAA